MTEEQVVQEVQKQQQTAQVDFNPFDDGAWQTSETVETQQTQVEQPTKPAAEEPAKPAFDPNSYLKEKFGWENEEVALQEVQKIREVKPQESVKFENEFSEKFFNLLKEGKEEEVYSFLEQKKRIDRLVDSPVDNVIVASEIVKVAMANKYKDLSPDEIDYKFNKQFAIPEKPTQGFDQSEEDYSAEVAKWEQRKAEIEKEIIIEAKVAKPEISSLKQDLKLPDLQKPEAVQTYEVDPAVRQQYEQALERDFSKFNGFNVVAKCEDAELPVAFAPTSEEKAQLKEKLFDFDSTEYLSQRWVSNDGAINVEQAMKDIYLLENKDAIFQKIANESAAKMLEHYIKSRGNIQVGNAGTQRTTTLSDKSASEKQEAAIWDA